MTLPSPLPNFLGIGAPRAGTTWLHRLLDDHPEVLMPSRRKELYFFDRHHERGLEWYADSFTVPADGVVPPRVGEVTPVYMYRPECRARIEALGTIDRFIVCLRNPVDLLWSGYRQNSAIYDFRGSLPEFMEVFPQVVDNGYYARALAPWFEQFGRDRFLLVRFDDLVRHPVETRTTVASFLDVDPERFPPDAGLSRVNQAEVPRFRRLYGLAKRSVTRLGRVDQTWVVDLAKKAGLKRLLVSGSRSGPPAPPPELLRSVAELYVQDLLELERLTGFDVRSWLPVDHGPGAEGAPDSSRGAVG